MTFEMAFRYQCPPKNVPQWAVYYIVTYITGLIAQLVKKVKKYDNKTYTNSISFDVVFLVMCR